MDLLERKRGEVAVSRGHNGCVCVGGPSLRPSDYVIIFKSRQESLKRQLFRERRMNLSGPRILVRGLMLRAPESLRSLRRVAVLGALIHAISHHLVPAGEKSGYA